MLRKEYVFLKENMENVKIIVFFIVMDLENVFDYYIINLKLFYFSKKKNMFNFNELNILVRN